MYWGSNSIYTLPTCPLRCFVRIASKDSVGAALKFMAS